MAEMKKQFLPVLLVHNTHGVHGELKCSLLCDDVSAIKNVKTVYTAENGAEAFSVRSLRGAKPFFLLSLVSIDTLQKAEPLKAKMLYAKRDDIQIPAGSYFISELIGLPVTDARTKEIYGTLTEILDNPANQIYRIQTKHGEVLFPVVREFIDHIDPNVGIFIKPIPGFFEKDDTSCDLT